MSHRFDQDVARFEQTTHQDSNFTAVTLMDKASVDLLRKLESPGSSNGSHLSNLELVDGDKVVAGPSPSRGEALKQPTDLKDLPQAANPKSDTCPVGPEPPTINLKPLEISKIPTYEPLPINIKPLMGENPCLPGGHYKPTPWFERPFGEPLPAFDKPWHRYDPISENPFSEPFHPFERRWPLTPPTFETHKLPEHISLIDAPPGGFKANQPDGSMQVVDEEGVKTFWPNGSVNVKNFDGTGYAYNPPKDAQGKPEYKHWGPKPEDNYSENVLILKSQDLENVIKY